CWPCHSAAIAGVYCAIAFSMSCEPSTRRLVASTKRTAHASAEASRFLTIRELASGLRIRRQTIFSGCELRLRAPSRAEEAIALSPIASTTAGQARLRIEKAVQVDDEIAHMRVVH